MHYHKYIYVGKDPNGNYFALIMGFYVQKDYIDYIGRTIKQEQIDEIHKRKKFKPKQTSLWELKDIVQKEFHQLI